MLIEDSYTLTFNSEVNKLLVSINEKNILFEKYVDIMRDIYFNNSIIIEVDKDGYSSNLTLFLCEVLKKKKLLCKYNIKNIMFLKLKTKRYVEYKFNLESYEMFRIVKMFCPSMLEE